MYGGMVSRIARGCRAYAIQLEGETKVGKVCRAIARKSGLVIATCKRDTYLDQDFFDLLSHIEKVSVYRIIYYGKKKEFGMKNRSKESVEEARRLLELFEENILPDVVKARGRLSGDDTIGDILADLLHYCQVKGYHFDHILEAARDSFEEELRLEEVPISLLVSSCCQAEVWVYGKTCYYVCEECEAFCDVKEKEINI